MKTTEKVTKLKTELQAYCEPRGFSVEVFGDIRSDNVVKVASKNPPKTVRVLYVKDRSSGKGFWGINPNVVNKFEGYQWDVILLSGSDARSYLGTSQNVNDGFKHWSKASPRLTKREKPTAAAGGDYKLHEDEITEEGWPQFDSYEELFRRLLPSATLDFPSGTEAEEESFQAQEHAAGFQASPHIRQIIENYAMGRAQAELGTLGFSNFKNTASRACYDYTCEGAGNLYYVEVKGTQGLGNSIILTKNELEHWQQHQQDSIAVIVHSIKLDSDGESFSPSGGTSRVCLPWILERVEAIQYKWTVSNSPEVLLTR